MQDYSDQRTLVKALQDHNFRVIKRCIEAGQSLNDKYFIPHGWLRIFDLDESLFLESCQTFGNSMFKSLLVMKKHVDFYATDNEGANCLIYCVDVYRLDVCLKILPPIDVNSTHTDKDTGEVFNALTSAVADAETKMADAYSKDLNSFN